MSIRDIMTEVCAVNRDHLTIGKHAHVLPVDLFISKRRPTMCPRLFQQLLNRPAYRSGEEHSPAACVEISDRITALRSDLLHPRRPEEIILLLCVVSVVAYDT